MNFSNWERFVKATIGDKYKPPVTPPQKPTTEVQADYEQPKKKKICT